LVILGLSLWTKRRIEIAIPIKEDMAISILDQIYLISSKEYKDSKQLQE
jgi:hypothetical protein